MKKEITLVYEDFNKGKHGKKIRDLCEYYWEIEDGKFVYHVKDIEEYFNISVPLHKIVGKLCKAFDTRCEKCDSPIQYFRSRYQYLNEYRHQDNICADCNNEQTEEGEGKEESKKIELMKQAFETNVYESLSEIEFNYLVALVKSASTDKANKKIGISDDVGRKIFEKIERLHLLQHNENNYSFLSEFEELLSNFNIEQTVKSIFGSIKALKAYRILKKKFLFIYPEIPLCAFIEKDQVECLFSESWHLGYFLTCRIDFIVTDKEGIPKSAIEYHGGYHNSKGQSDKDDFKKLLLEKVGLPLKIITTENFDDLEIE